MAISMPSIFGSTNDMISLQNSIESLLILQLPDGRMPYAEVPFSDLNTTSFTYHLYNLITVANYYHYTGDVAYLQSIWDRYTNGLAWSLSSIDSTGLMDVTASAEWLRVSTGGHNIEANAILYYTINQAIILATVLNSTSQVSNWTTAAGIKAAANSLLWNVNTGLYTDNETTTLSPHDGNSWAIKSNLTLKATQILNISSCLQARWGEFGAPAPEAGGTLGTVSRFIGGFELEAHFLANNSLAALQLMHLQWGFMLNDPRMTNSIWIEGYSTDGSLHYAPHTNDPRISHAHGWSSGPTLIMSFYVAVIQSTSANGQTWSMAFGDLSRVQAGFKSPLGDLSSSIVLDSPNGMVTGFNLSTPAGTSRQVLLPGYEGTLVELNGNNASLVGGVVTGLAGRNWTFTNLTKASTSSKSGASIDRVLKLGSSLILAGVVAIFMV